MGWITDLLQEVPLSAVMKERIALIEERCKQANDENAKLKQQVESLTRENESLKQQIAALKPDKQFVEQSGVLWHRDGGGTYLPYCPTCKLTLSKVPPWSPDMLRCSKCKWLAPITPSQADMIATSIAR